MAIGQGDATFGFEGRLAAENGWSRSFAERVAAEYRRFLILVATHGEPLTPSDAVDQAWHLHLTYSRDYWHGLCRDILARELHHDPTTGGADRREHYRERYAFTLAAYRSTFDAEPPADIWPDPATRFAAEFQRIDRSRTLLLGAEEAAGIGIALVALVVFLLRQWTILVMLLLAAAAIGAFVFGILLSRRAGSGRFRWSFEGDGDADGCSGGDGGCGGGCGCG